MSKFIRYGLVTIVLLVVVLLAAPFFIDVNVYKGQIEKMVKDQTGRVLHIGNIEASLLPWVGVELSDVHLANRSGFAQRDFLSVERLHVKLALMPLLSKKIEIEHFEIVSPVVYLERRKNGENNWDDLIVPQPPVATLKPALYVVNGVPAVKTVALDATSDAAAAPLLAALQAESLSLLKGQVTWVDAGAAPVVLSDLDVILKDVRLDRPVAVNISGKLANNAFLLDAHVGPLGDLAKLNPITLPIQGHFTADDIQLKPFKQMITGWPEQLGDVAKASVGVVLNFEQHPDGIRLGEGSLHVQAAHDLVLDWKVELPNLNVLKINHVSLAVDDKALLKVKGDVKQLSSNPTFQLRLDGQPIARTWLEAFVPDLKAMYGDHPAPWETVQFNAVLAGNSKKLKINDLQLKLDRELLNISGDVVYAGPEIRLRMAAKQLHLDAWIPQGKEQGVSKTAWNDVSFITSAIAAAPQKPAVEPDLRFLSSWKVASQLKVKTLFMRGLEMGNFSAIMNGNQGHFKLDPLRFTLSGGKVTETASLNVTTYPVRWKESVHITGVQAGPLLKTLANTDMLAGTLDMDTKFHARGLTPDAVKTLNGHGKMLFKNGTLKGFDIAGALRKFTNPAAYKAGSKETDFAQLSGSFDVKNGIADNRDLFMASPLLRVTGEGTINLVQKTLDYKVNPRVVGSLKGQGGNLLRRGLTVPLHIYGPFDAPKIKPIINAKTLLQNAPALLNKGGLHIGGSLGKILDRVNQRNKAAPAPKGSPNKTQPLSPEKQLLNNLGGLIPGF